MPKTKEELSAVQAAEAIIASGPIPGGRWILGDNLCDCAFQRIGDWTNPYIAQTLRVRLCCLWEKMFAQYPELVQRIPAYYDMNRDVYVSTPAEWGSQDMDMPIYL